MPSRDASKRRFLDQPPVEPSTRPKYLLQGGHLSFLASATNRPDDFWIDCSFLLSIPSIAKDIATALSQLAEGYRSATYRGWMVDVKHGIVAFLTQTASCDSITTRSFDRQLVGAYIKYLERVDEKTGRKINPCTRLHRLTVVRKLIQAFVQLGLPVADDHYVPSNPWPLANSKRRCSDPTGEVDAEEHVRFYEYCRSSVEEILRDVKAIWADDELSRHNERTQESDDGDWVERSRILNLVRSTFQGPPPERQVLWKVNREICELIDKYGYTRMLRSFGPYGADLCAFVYYLSYLTALNMQPLVDLKSDDVILTSSMGRSVVRIRTVKNRAKAGKKYSEGSSISKAFAVSADPMCPANILLFLKRWSSGLAHAQSSTPGQLFTFIGKRRSTNFDLQTYAMTGKRAGETTFIRHTTAFCKRGGFRWIGTRAIRDHVAQVADQIFCAQTARVKDLLDHRDVETTRNNYQNGIVLARQSQHLARAMEKHTRWSTSKGRVDPRDLPAHHDGTAATDGFTCIDPYDSPMPGQRKGRLCTAFAECPRCPLAMIELTNSRSAARCLELKGQFERTKELIGEVAFNSRWRESYEAIAYRWLPSFGSDVMVAAKVLLLSKLPDIE